MIKMAEMCWHATSAGVNTMNVLVCIVNNYMVNNSAVISYKCGQFLPFSIFEKQDCLLK